MPFSVQDFRDLVRLLEERPEWREELRRLLLTDELLQLPAVFTKSQSRVLQSLQSMAGSIEDLAQAQSRTEARIGDLAQAQVRTESAIEALADQLRKSSIRLDSTVGTTLELKYRSKAPAFLGRVLKRPRVVSFDDLDDILDAAVASGVLSESEAQEVRLADAIVVGSRRDDDVRTYFVMEISALIDRDDIYRAARRAELLSRTGVVTAAIVAGERVDTFAAPDLESSRVWTLTDGAVRPPV